MGTLHLKFYSCLRLRFPDVETNPGPRRPVPASCRILCSNVRGLSGNLSDLAVASSQYDVLLCSGPWSQICVMCQSYWFLDSVALSACAGSAPRARGMAAYERDGYGVFRQPKFECGCCEMLVVRVCGLRQNFYVYCLYRNPDLDDRIYDC